MPRTVKDITGERFGKLVVAGFAGYGQSGKQRVSLWKCQCDCGNNCIVQGYLLKNGRRKSCGCIRSTPEQMIGKRFGKLTVIAEDTENFTTLQKAVCRCDCGREKSVATRDLKNGKVTSCGCDRVLRRQESYPEYWKDKKMEEKLAAFRRGEFTAVETLEDWVYVWIHSVLPNVVKETTICMYSDTMERHILPCLGRELLSGLTEKTIMQWIRTLQKNPVQGTQNGWMTEGTVRNTLSVLSGCMRDAQKTGLIDRNPCTETAWTLRGKNIWEEKNWLSEEQLVTLKPVLFAYQDEDGYPLGLGFQLILYTGMTLSETAALRWKEVDFQNAEFHLEYFLAVKRETGQEDSRRYELEPLTGRKRRIIPVPDLLLEEMENTRRRYEGKPEEFVLSKSGDMPVRIDRMRAALMRRAQSCGMGKVTPRMLRDTYAIRAVQAGASSDTVAELMGFASSQQVIRRYMPRETTDKKELMKKMFHGSFTETFR